MSGQDAASAERNAEFFARDKHGRDVAALDTYRLIREAITREVAGARRLLDDIAPGNAIPRDRPADRPPMA